MRRAIRTWRPFAMLRVVVLALAVLVVTASECPFIVFPGIGAFICFTEVPVGAIAPGRRVLELREFCPDGPVIGNVGFFFLGPGAGVPSPTYEKLPGGEIRMVSGAIAIDNESIVIDGAPEAVSGFVVGVLHAAGVFPPGKVVLKGFDASGAPICEASFGHVPDNSFLLLLCNDPAQLQLQALDQAMELNLSNLQILPTRGDS